MRLIDGKALADEILGEIYERGQASGLWEQQLEIGALTYRDIEFANGYDKALDGVYRKISNTPTVKAIPIEWIDNWGKKNTCFYGDNYNVITILLKDWEREKRVELVNKELQNWEKENETR